MTDSLTPTERSLRMASIRGKNTKPEVFVRRMIHALGYRFRLYRRDLPGTPDLVFPGRRAVIFVHGCFWHGHQGCKLARLPKSRVDFWRGKLEENRARDDRSIRDLVALGWRVLVVWECELRDKDALAKRLVCFLEAEEME